jgi:transposase
LSYSQYCALYSKHLKNGDLRLHVPHAPGEDLYVDYAGPKIRIEPPGQTPYFVSLFVAVMGRSSYTFAFITLDMEVPSWIEAHRKAFEYLGGVPCAVIPDRTRTAVASTHRIEPHLNRAFRELSEERDSNTSMSR